jgi:hypothetical protein
MTQENPPVPTTGGPRWLQSAQAEAVDDRGGLDPAMAGRAWR